MRTCNKVLLPILLLISTFTTSFSIELCNPSDKKALLYIKQSFGNPEILASWLNTTDCCKDWYQVECDPTTHRIISVTIFSGTLSGEIPSSIGDLPYLQTLVIRHLTNIYGPIPSAIAKLTNLNFVRLSFTNLTGPVPSFFSQLTKLTYLDLSFNQLTGSIPPSLAQLPNLNDLHLDRNQLTGSIPESFGSFEQADFYLYLSHNQLSGPIPSSLRNVKFTYVDFSRNQLIGDASFLFGKDKELQQIDLSRNMLAFNMSNLEFDSSLISIDLNHNKIYGSLPDSLTELPSLQSFNVSYNKLCGKIPTGGQLSSIDASAYIHNKCLCGAPLSPCAMELKIESIGHKLDPSPSKVSAVTLHPSKANSIQQAHSLNHELCAGPERVSLKGRLCPWILMVKGLMERVQQLLKKTPRSYDQKTPPARATSSPK